MKVAGGRSSLPYVDDYRLFGGGGKGIEVLLLPPLFSPAINIPTMYLCDGINCETER